MSENNQTNGGGNSQSPPPPPTPPAPKEKEKKRVEVICEGTLGHLLLKKGDVTDNEDYVGLLKTKRGRTLVKSIG